MAADTPNAGKVEEAFIRAAEWLHGKNGFTPEMISEQPVRSLIEETAAVLNKAVSYGLSDSKPSEKLVEGLRNSTYMFSGFKSFHEMKEAANLLVDGKGNKKPFNQYLNDVQKINATYNKNYLKAEYDFASGSAQMAAKWDELVQDGDRYDLQYRTAGDDKVRESHEKLHDITLPVDSKFWDDYFPPNGWNCFPEDTLVLMGNGTWKDIEKIERGESVIGGSGQQQLVTGVHIKPFDGEMTCIYAEGKSATCTPNHRFFTAEGWVTADTLTPGDILLQVGKVGFKDKTINAVHNLYTIARYLLMSLKRKRKTITPLTVDNKM